MTRLVCCISTLLAAAVLVIWASLPSEASPSPLVVSVQDRAFLEDMEHRGVLYFWEQTDPATGLVLDRADQAGGRAKGPSRNIASLAATGFGLTAICIGAEHGWIPRDEAAQRIRATLQFFATRALHEHGWFYHWMDVSNGERQWDSEISSVDTSFFLGGALTAARYFSNDPDIPRLAHEIYDRVDFPWMLDGEPLILSHGWKRGKSLKYRWETYSESSLLYLLAIGSPTHPISAQSWYAWQRPLYTYGPYQFVSGGPLFTHQYSHAWVDFRTRRDRGFLDFFQNSVNATRANRLYCSNLHQSMALSFGPDIWGITASDGPKGYRTYGEIKYFEPVDGTIAPCASGGSLMFTPDISIPTLRAMRDQYQDRLYGRYGFVDAYNPELKWFDTDVVGIDLGITLLSAENLLSGNVWRWFMSNEAVPHAMDLVGFSAPPDEAPAAAPKKPAGKTKRSVPARSTKKSAAH